jgi:DNA polymerase
VTNHATIDFETYSEAGAVWDPVTSRWQPPPGARKRGLPGVGAAAYAEHPSTDVLCVSYRLPGQPVTRWRPGDPPPTALFDYLAAGGVIESHNAMFERLIWENVLTPRYGWPTLPAYQQRCSMATARVNTLPGALSDLSAVLRLPTPKDADGKRLLDKFSQPRNPTAKDPRTRITPEDDPEDFARLMAYCDTDVMAEEQASARMTPMSADELTFWWVDQEINHRGMGVDRAGIRDCIAVLDEALARYGDECRTITGFDPTQLAALGGWLAVRGVHMPSMDADAVEAALERPTLPADARRVLELRQLIGSASVKKLYAMENQACRDDRLRNLLTHHGARTGRPTGEGPQPLNLPKAGPQLATCAGCSRPFRPAHTSCPWCGAADRAPGSPRWRVDMVDHVLAVMAYRSLPLVEWYFGDALLCISGCIRGLFVARDGYTLMASDYSAIEAVVIAMLAGEQWRIDAFTRGDPIYLVSASKITGVPVAEYLAHASTTGEHHPDRQCIGKVAELGLGFGGWVNAWLAFDSSGRFTDDEIKRLILAWRDASPAIVEFWGGQHRGRPWDRDRRAELYGVEGHAVLALLNPGTTFRYQGMLFFTRDHPSGSRALIIRLLSGRELTYHDAALSPSARDPSEYAITYWTWNSNPKYGRMGWVAMSTFGGRLVENIVQATAHDIMRHGVLGLRAAGYPTILHVYDEILVEVPEGTGCVEELERIMATMPDWAAGWPIRADGGWSGKRYRKA